MKGKVAVFRLNGTIITVLKPEVITIYGVLGFSQEAIKGKVCPWSECQQDGPVFLSI